MPRKKQDTAAIVPAEPTPVAVLATGIDWVAKPGQPKMAVINALGLEAVRELTRSGHNPASIGHHLGISAKTLRECAKRQPEVDHAIEVGKAILDHEIHNLLYQQGKKGYAPALMFLAKCRLGWRENDTPTAKPNITIGHLHLPDSKSPEEFVRSIVTQGDTPQLPEETK